MRELLDSATKRRLELLEQLNERGTWISSNELAKNNNASLRTINSDVHYLKDRWSPFLLIETSKKNGVRLNTPPSSHARLIYTSVAKNSEAFQFLERIFFEPTHNIENWVDELYISESSLYRIANQLTASLNKFGMDLQKRPCKVISTDEMYIRYFYTTYFMEVYGIHEWPFEINREELIHFTQKIFLKLDPFADDAQLMYATYIIAISLTRLSQNEFTDVSQIQKISPHQRGIFSESLDELETIAQQIHLQITERHVDDLVNTIFLYRIFDENDEEQISVQKDISTFIHTIQENFSLTSTPENEHRIINAIMQIYLHKKTYPFDNHILFNQYDYNGATIKENFPILTKVVYRELKKMEDASDFPWYSVYRNNILYWLMIKWKELPNQLENKKKKAKILVLSDLGYEHAEMLVHLINKNFSSKADVSAYDESILFLNDNINKIFTKYDYFISTFYSELFPAERAIVVDAIPSNLDWGYIRKAVNTVRAISPVP